MMLSEKIIHAQKSHLLVDWGCKEPANCKDNPQFSSDTCSIVLSTFGAMLWKIENFREKSGSFEMEATLLFISVKSQVEAYLPKV